MQKLPEHITEDLLAKHFAGEATDKERCVVQEWVDQSEENQELLFQYEMIWKDLGVIEKNESISLSVDVDAAWNELNDKKKLQELQVSSPFGTWLKIAASIFVVFGLFALISQLDEEELLLSQTAENTLFIQLADGSGVTLNSNSSLEYPENFDNQERPVQLQGEAFFDIAKNPEKPFSVKIGEAQILVLGTSFNIKSNKNADTVSVSVSTGQVRFSFRDQSVELNPGEKATLFALQEQIVKMEGDLTGLDQFWRTGLLTFTGQNLSEVVQTLSLAYKKQINLTGSDFSGCSLSADFENDSLDNILQVIALTLNLEVQENGETISLSGDGCVTN
ncbi:MAG: FecR domain-containing protein [Cyclobacteriaceae bacterium]